MVFSEIGKIFSWGDNSHGQLGTGDFLKRSTPFETTGINNGFNNFKKIFLLKKTKNNLIQFLLVKNTQ